MSRVAVVRDMRWSAGPSRRHLIHRGLTVGGVVLLAGCGAIRAPWQPVAIPTIGLLTSTLDPLRTGFIEALKQGLRDLGYVEGTTLVIELRNADGDSGRLPALAAELVARGVALLVAGASPEVDAARGVTPTVPIVGMNMGGDPVAQGIVGSLARPGGNLTGLTNLSRNGVPKALELLQQMLPDLGRLAVLYNPTVASKTIEIAELRAAADTMRIAVRPFEVRSADDVERALGVAVAEKTEALFVLTDSVTNGQLPRIAAFVQANRLPALSPMPAFPAAGGLTSYGTSVAAMWRRGATYVDKILRGASPADLPIEQPTVFDFIVNLRSAQALGLTIPQSVLAQATEVLQ